ncbi:hypothetical protein TESG_08337 [Trichophyton tonsurans CBS 112818]|uniref:Uncharacterized protein n=1 Tax=Trichophyton tonsurans (strain CBS 112818) TaxID=647933 RepID=F2RTC9_TRIT1|nr:hypothetical protein TESG_08337 [Trichophyton tonsurans CBS 112818]
MDGSGRVELKNSVDIMGPGRIRLKEKWRKKDKTLKIAPGELYQDQDQGQNQNQSQKYYRNHNLKRKRKNKGESNDTGEVNEREY